VVGNGVKRGAITGMSFHAAARLRETVMTRTPPGEAFSLTGTTRRARSDAEWRGIMKRFRMMIVRQDLAAVWRVELQKRKAPHVHAIVWINQEFQHQDEIDAASMRLRWAWLRAIGAVRVRRNGISELVDLQELNHAAVVECGLTPGWLAYLAGHASKHKAEQLGWQGKQWGIWGAEKFAPVHALERREVSGPQKRLFDRSLRRWQRAKLRRIGRRGPRALPRSGTYVRCYQGGELARLLRFVLGEGVDPRASWDWHVATERERSLSLPLPALGWTGNAAATQSGLVSALTR
jgi:hypothetical protein